MSQENPTPRKPPVENFSFDALREEMGDVFPTHKEVEVPETSATGERLSMSEQEALREKKEWEAKINAKVLGASAAVSPPMWIRGFVLAGVSIAVLFFLVLNTGFQSFQPMGSYITMVIGAGATLWNVNGILKDEEPRDRGLATVGAVLSAAVVGLAFLRMGG